MNRDKHIYQSPRILLVEDDPVQADTILKMLRQLEQMKRLENPNVEHWDVCWFENITEALVHIRKKPFDLILLDFQLKENLGLDLLKEIVLLNPSTYNSEKTSIVMLSAYSTTSRVVDALKLGASDFLEKPISTLQLKEILEQYVYSFQNKKTIHRQTPPKQKESNGEMPQVASVKSMSFSLEPSLGMVFHPNSPFVETLRLGKLVANKSCPVFLQGESGTGKEVLSSYIHQSSLLKGSFVPINCGALSENLVESEFFGHKKGAFTGADSDYTGCFLQANNGTLFLDEVGELPLHIQTRLLRVLQEKKVRPLGGDQEYPVSFRLISATHKNLKSLVEQGLFREDLYYRLCVFPIELPPLRKRLEDLPLLVEFFLKEHGLSEKEVAHWVHKLPSHWWDYLWPGNIRELRNLVDRLMVFKEMDQGWEETMDLHHGLPSVPLIEEKELITKPFKLPKKRRVIGEQEILEALQQNQYHREKTAAALGISRRSLQYRLARME